jgi:hypothetical protein
MQHRLDARLCGSQDENKMSSTSYSPKKRAEEKQRSRDRDERALASGEKSAEQLRRENGRIALLRVRIDYSGAKSLV